MRTFIWHDAKGTIVSVCRAEVLAPNRETPFDDIGPDDGVMEVTDRKALADLPIGEIHDGYRVAVTTGKLIKKR